MADRFSKIKAFPKAINNKEINIDGVCWAKILVSNFMPAKDVYQITTTGIATVRGDKHLAAFLNPGVKRVKSDDLLGGHFLGIDFWRVRGA